ncbi:hypothetical protein L6452_27048 [Arctium lappa]|uniref:Uncharacterized protein n=1 Tax=Arctium lappa TaxID=4217 RepID=A0ACB8ZWL1_ARCLA|nr:hypothetical protein L6452_27048 [Arctium lappa]
MVHRQGAAVWGGASTFNRLMRYAYPQVKLIDFSPGEKHLVTYSSHETSTPHDSHELERPKRCSYVSGTVCVAEPHSNFATAVPGGSTDLGPRI